MSEESTTPDLVELTRHALEAASRHDADALMGFYAPDAVLDLSAAGIGTFEGVAAMRSFLEDWWGTWGDHLVEVEEIVDLGHDVVFSRTWEDGRLLGSDSHVEQRVGWVFLWVQGMLERQTVYLDIDDRADFDAIMSRWGSDSVWDMSPMGLGLYEGAAVRRFFEDWRGSYEEYGTETEDVLELGEGVTLAVVVQNGRPVGSDGHVHIRYAAVLVWQEGLIVRITTYTDIDEARAAAERLAAERAS